MYQTGGRMNTLADRAFRRAYTPIVGRTTRVGLAALALFLAVAGNLGGVETRLVATATRTFYVDSVAGSDSYSGRSTDRAWRTVARLESASLVAGDRVRFRRDRVWRDRLDIGWSGTSVLPITFDAYGTGARPVIAGPGTCVEIPGSYIVVRYLKASGCTWAGVSIGGDHVLVEHSTMTGNAAGVMVRRTAYRARLLANSIVDNTRMSVLTDGGDDDSGAFGVLLQGDRTEVAFNTISGHDAFSYDYGRDGAAVEIYGATRSHIHHNIARNNHAFTELGDPRSADNTYAYNVVRSSLSGSTFLITRGASSGWGPVMRTKLYNNTVVMSGTGTQGFICHGGCSPDILTMRNNIIQAVWKVGYADAPFNGNYNVYWIGQRQFTLGGSDRVANPKFVSQTNSRLLEGSPAINTGVLLSYTFDIFRKPIVGKPDRGAREYQG